MGLKSLVSYLSNRLTVTGTHEKHEDVQSARTLLSICGICSTLIAIGTSFSGCEPNSCPNREQTRRSQVLFMKCHASPPSRPHLSCTILFSATAGKQGASLLVGVSDLWNQAKREKSGGLCGFFGGSRRLDFPYHNSISPRLCRDCAHTVASSTFP